MRKEISFISVISFVLLAIFFLLPLSSLSQTPNNLQPPEDINQIKEEAQKTGKSVLQRLPEAVKQVWRNEILPLWRKMWSFFKIFWEKTLGPYLSNLWYNHLKPFIEKIVIKIEKMAGKKIEENKPQVQEEFQKKKEETKKELEKQLPKATQTIWDKLKEVIK